MVVVREVGVAPEGAEVAAAEVAAVEEPRV